MGGWGKQTREQTREKRLERMGEMAGGERRRERKKEKELSVADEGARRVLRVHIFLMKNMEHLVISVLNSGADAACNPSHLSKKVLVPCNQRGPDCCWLRDVTFFDA